MKKLLIMKEQRVVCKRSTCHDQHAMEGLLHVSTKIVVIIATAATHTLVAKTIIKIAQHNKSLMMFNHVRFASWH